MFSIVVNVVVSYRYVIAFTIVIAIVFVFVIISIIMFFVFVAIVSLNTVLGSRTLRFPLSPLARLPVSAAMAPKRPGPCRRTVVSAGVLCSGCGTECADNAENWFEDELNDAGDKVPKGPFCYPCGSYVEKKRIKPEDFIKAADSSKGKKRVGDVYKKDLDQHKESLHDLSSRDFVCYDIFKDTMSGTYTEDSAAFQTVNDFKAKHAGMSPEELSLGQVSHRFPGCQRRVGLLLASSGSSTDRVVPGPIQFSVDGEGPSAIVRWTGTRITMRETILDGAKDFCLFVFVLLFKYIYIYIFIIFLL